MSARTSDDNHVMFAVADTGIGIPPEHHETIFQEFSQVENPLQERHRGTGLGLPLCRNLAMLLGGRLWLESEVGVGSTFYAEIPVVYRGESAHSEEAAELPTPEFHRAPVLIIEDDPPTASLFESYLRHSEFQPIVVRDAAQAEVWIKRHEPVAVLADIYIGNDPIWGFISGVRGSLPSLPLIITSAHDEGQQAIAKGASVFLLKPISRDVLLRELRQFTAQTGLRRLLIVDDNEVSRYIVRELLDRPWLEVAEAANGTEAIRLIRQNCPDAVILDLLMPDMSGIEVLQQLRQEYSTQMLPVLIYTSKPLSEMEKLELENFGTSVVRKEDVATRLSAQPFLDWLESAGIIPKMTGSEQNA